MRGLWEVFRKCAIQRDLGVEVSIVPLVEYDILSQSIQEVKAMHVYIREIPCHKDPSDCLLPGEMFESLRLSLGVLYTLSFGGTSFRTFLGKCRGPLDSIYFSKKLLGKLMLPKDITLNIWRRGERVCLGPVVGIFVNNRFMELIRLGKPALIAAETMEASRAAGTFAYYFSINSVDWRKRMVKGYLLSPFTENWEEGLFPLPNVVYDRGINFTDEQKPMVEELWERIGGEPGIKLVNTSHRLEKWQLHKGLIKYVEISWHLPETILYEDFNSVKKILDKYGFVFIKSSQGSRGQEVFSVEKTEDGYNLVFNRKGLKETRVESLEEVQSHVTRFVGGKQFIVQQGIRLIKHLGHCMDIRILIIKNEVGKWEAVKYYCRIAKGSLTITNTSAGGDVDNYDKIYPDLISTSGNEIIPDKVKLEKITKEIASCIEKECGTMGEMGIDLGIAEDGSVWFFEANGKPSKALIKGVDDAKGVNIKALKLFEYAKYLAEK